MELGKSNNYVEAVNELLKVLSEKENIVVSKRYGLKNSQEMTLAAIGTEYGITRERVRQIQENALKKLKRQVANSALADFHRWVEEVLIASGGIMTEKDLTKKMVETFNKTGDSINELLLACEISSRVKRERNKVDFEPHFKLNEISFEFIKNTLDAVSAYLLQENKIQDINALYKAVGLSKDKLTIEGFKSILQLDRRLVLDSRGVSLIDWRFVNPKTLYDKILFVLNDYCEPLHFSEIAKKIEDSNFDNKVVSVQAVHNELINNPIFVLIGRGIYALKTWGYKEGTVSDVIESILSKSGPMHLYDLTQEVLQRRKVKPVTVQINLNSKKAKFRKNSNGMYELAN